VAIVYSTLEGVLGITSTPNLITTPFVSPTILATNQSFASTSITWSHDNYFIVHMNNTGYLTIKHGHGSASNTTWREWKIPSSFSTSWISPAIVAADNTLFVANRVNSQTTSSLVLFQSGVGPLVTSWTKYVIDNIQTWGGGLGVIPNFN